MLTTAQVLATNNFGDTRSGSLAGPMGLFMIVVLGVATVLLIRNMNARLRRLPDRFPGQPPVGPGQAPDGQLDRSADDVLDPTDGYAPNESSGSAPKGSDLRNDPNVTP
ncbi:hypothetical protein [Micromonospora zhanjiangensis]|uniref:Uncharacterized protein n=1 Tax=Micromonospora zhanjiangensis TaxID=1522057 RepID=A0ABV8KT56_9ACTN